MTTLITALVLAIGLQGLPDYRPIQKQSGTLRSRGNDQMASLMKRWQKGFHRHHPDLRFADALEGTGSGIHGLEMRTADLALMGRAMYPFEHYGSYERSWMFPVQIEVAPGSFAKAHKSPAVAIFVHRD